MKSFQDWLDCQLYSSHLKNLTKIKQQSLYMKTIHINRKLATTPKNVRNISNLQSPPQQTFKNRHHNIKCQMQKNQIMKQNLNLISRLVNVSPVISKDRQVESYRKYQSLFKKNMNNKRFDYIKSNKLRKFIKVNQSNFIQGVHKSIVKIRFLMIPFVPQGKQPTIWVQLFSGAQKIRSSNYTLGDIIVDQIKFPLKREIDKNIMIRLNCSRGLAYINLGDYYLEIPQQELSIQQLDLISQQDSRKSITINIQIEKLVPYRKHKSFCLR